MAFFELRAKHDRIGGKETVGSEFGARVARFHHFIQHFFVGLLPGWAGIIEDSPAIWRTGKQETLFDSAHDSLVEDKVTT